MIEKKELISQRDIDEINSENQSFDKFNEILNDPSEQDPWPKTSINAYSKAAQASSMAMLRAFQLEAKIALCADLKVNGQSVDRNDLFHQINFLLYRMPDFKMIESSVDNVIFLNEHTGDVFEVIF